MAWTKEEQQALFDETVAAIIEQEQILLKALCLLGDSNEEDLEFLRQRQQDFLISFMDRAERIAMDYKGLK